MPEESPRKTGVFKSCLTYLGGGWLVFSLMITALICLIVLTIGTLSDSETEAGSNVSSKTVSGYNRDSDDYIAVIPVHGVIMYGKSKSGIVTPNQISAMLEKAEKDSDVKAVIVSIDSPGGEVNAADEIYRRILKFRSKTKRPVIALMRTIAASGGYYIAAACDKIVAADMTLTGSIGVIISSYNVTGLLNKIGVQGEVYKSGKMKDMLSPTRERTPEEQRIVQELVQECYVKFAGIVSKSRKIPLSKITGGPIGDGRVYHGTKALAYGMVDKLGYLEDAVALCEELSKSGRNSLTVKTYKKDFDFMEKFLEEKIFLKDGINLKLNLPGNAPAVELKPGRLYYLPAGL